jgi:ribosomal protein L34E
MDAAILPRLTSLSLWFDARQRASVRDRFQDSRRRCRSQCIGWLRTPSASLKLHWQSRGQPSSATCEGLFCGRCLSGMQRLRSECHYRMCLTGRAETADNWCVLTTPTPIYVLHRTSGCLLSRFCISLALSPLNALSAWVCVMFLLQLSHVIHKPNNKSVRKTVPSEATFIPLAILYCGASLGK